MKNWKTELPAILKNKKWSIGLIGFMLLFNAPFIYFTNNFGFKRLVFVYLLCFLSIAVFSTFCLFLKDKLEKIYLTVLFVLSLLPNCIVFSYILISKTFMRGEMFWVIFETNVKEASEFADNFSSYSITWGIICYIVACLFLLYKSGSSERLPWKKYKVLAFAAFAVLLVLIGTKSGTKGVGLMDFYKNAWLYYKSEEDECVRAKHRSEIKMDVQSQLPDTCSHTFVFIIGESLGRAHMELYGYFRPTNPAITAMGSEVTVYNNVIASATYTIPSLRNVLTFANSQYPEYEYEKPSIVGLFNAAGFETYWISNQQLNTQKSRGYDAVALEAKHVVSFYEDHQPDGIVLPELEKALAQDSIKKKMIFIHLMGCHMNYSARYPQSFNFFSYKKDLIPDKLYLTDQKKSKIDEYDNAVRYNDYIISSIFKLLKQKDESSCAVYFSDHGEEVYDFRDFMGHELNNASAYQYEVPFFFWASPKFHAESANLVIDKNRPFSTENFIYCLSDLARLRYADYNPEFSLFAPEFKPQERKVSGFIYRDKNGQ